MVQRRGRRQALRQLLTLFPTGTLVDLATGHGDFALLAADAGWDVTAVDARTERFPDDPEGRVRWMQSDVRDVDLAPYDVVLCLGLFYHLTAADQIDLLSRAASAGKPMIIDTHVDHGEHEHQLSERLTVADRYVGRLLDEPQGLKASWGNPTSFWPTLESFHRMLADCGFTTVLTLEPWIRSDRTFFVALPERAVSRAARDRDRAADTVEE